MQFVSQKNLTIVWKCQYILDLFILHRLSRYHDNSISSYITKCTFVIQTTSNAISVMITRALSFCHHLLVEFQGVASFVGPFCYLYFMFILNMLSFPVQCTHAITCWEKAGLLTLLCFVFSFVLSLSHQVWYLIVAVRICSWYLRPLYSDAIILISAVSYIIYRQIFTFY